MKNISLVALAFVGLCFSCTTLAQNTINTLAHYDLRPELLEQTDPPNIMIVFDNSGSMTWNLNGNGLTGGASNVNSRSFIARTAMQQVFNGLQDTANLGLTVYSAASCGSSGNNWGSLRANIADFDPAANANFQNLLATEDNSNAQAPGIIRSGGCTPIAATLDTVQDYVTGGLAAARNQTGGAVTAVPNQQCSTTDAVILVSDGSANGINPNIGCNVNNATTCSTQKVSELEALGWETYVVGFGGAPGLANNLNAIAAGATDDETGLPRTFFPAANGAQLVAVFDAILGDIFQRASSGSSAAVSTSSNQDAGFFVQSSYVPLVEGTPHNGSGTAVAAGAANAVTEEAYWSGLSRMLFVDPFGFVREDTNTNQTFDATDYSADRAIRIEVNNDGKTVFRRLTITIQPDGIPLETSQGAQRPIAELRGLWELNESLDNLYKLNSATPALDGNGEIKMQNDEIKSQRDSNNFDDTNRRYIVTNINGNRRDFTYDDGSSGNFGDDPIKASEIGYLGLGQGQTVAAKDLIDWVRGADDAEGAGGLRSRTVFTDAPSGGDDYQRFLLGDAIHSTPVVVGAPSEPFFEIYGDQSYKTFRDNNSNRRTVAYISTNDGMIHAVNSGRYNPINRSFDPAGIPLGFEMWAYIPESVLPHLRFLAANTYTANTHIYTVDGPTIVRDVKVGGNWRTFLFASTGYGGFDHQIDTDLTDTNPFDDLLKPSIVILDVTDPESPPAFVAEIKDNLGATTVTPAVYHRGGQSYLAVGTGPSAGFSDGQRTATNNNTPRDEMKGHSSSNQGQVLLYQLNSNSVSLVTTLSGFGDGFIGDIASIDWDFEPDSSGNSEYDALYFGLNSGSGENNDISGKLVRAVLDNNSTQDLVTGHSFDNIPFLARDRDQSWIFAGTGRVNTKEVFESNEQNRMFGIRESFDNDGDIIPSPTPGYNDLVDVSGIQVQFDGDLVNNGGLPASQDPDDDNNSIDTFEELATEIEEYHRGWVRDKNSGSPSERVPGRATTPGSNIVTYIGFTPQNPNQCSVGGESTLYNLAFSTGTAAYSEALAILNPGDENNIISDSQVIADTLVKEFTTLAADKRLFQQQLLEEIGGVPDPVLPDAAVADNPCAAGDTGNGVCVGADGTNPDCSIPLPGECGFGRKSFREIDFRYFR